MRGGSTCAAAADAATTQLRASRQQPRLKVEPLVARFTCSPAVPLNVSCAFCPEIVKVRVLAVFRLMRSA